MLATALALNNAFASNKWPLGKWPLGWFVLGWIALNQWRQQRLSLGWRWATLLLSVGLGQIVASCAPQATVPPRHVQLQQVWELQPGDQVAGHMVEGSLGDVSLNLAGGSVYAPFDGQVEPMAQPHCVIFSTAEVPAYLFRLCGLQRPRLGQVRQGTVIGRGQYLHFGTLRMQPEGTWALVEPASMILERTLQPESVESMN